MIKLFDFHHTTKADKAATMMTATDAAPWEPGYKDPATDAFALYSHAADMRDEYLARARKAEDDRHRLSLLLMSVFMNLRAAFDKGDLEEQWQMVDRINESLASFPLPESISEVVRQHVAPLEHAPVEYFPLADNPDLPF